MGQLQISFTQESDEKLTVVTDIGIRVRFFPDVKLSEVRSSPKTANRRE
jgi:hypothetical protein